MLEVKGNEVPILRRVLMPRTSSEEKRAHYIVPKGKSSALDDIHVGYWDYTELVSGDVIQEREKVQVGFIYPKGKTNRDYGFEALNRDYAHVSSDSRQEPIPKDILEVLANTMPLEVRRLLPALPKKKQKK